MKQEKFWKDIGKEANDRDILYDLPEVPLIVNFSFVESKVLDLCCGEGRHAKYLSDRGHEVYGIDISSENVKKTKKLLGSDAKIAVGDLYKLPFSENYFKTVLLFDTFHHLEKPEQAIKEVKRVLVPGGKLFLNTISDYDDSINSGYSNARDSDYNKKEPFADFKESGNLFDWFSGMLSVCDKSTDRRGKGSLDTFEDGLYTKFYSKKTLLTLLDSGLSIFNHRSSSAFNRLYRYKRVDDPHIGVGSRLERHEHDYWFAIYINDKGEIK